MAMKLLLIRRARVLTAPVGVVEGRRPAAEYDRSPERAQRSPTKSRGSELLEFGPFVRGERLGRGCAFCADIGVHET